MIEFICAGCGNPIYVSNSLTIASVTTIKMEPCEYCVETRCNDEGCSKFNALRDDLQATITQQNVDIEGNDEMIQKIRKLSEEWGGKIEKEINDILEGDADVKKEEIDQESEKST